MIRANVVSRTGVAQRARASRIALSAADGAAADVRCAENHFETVVNYAKRPAFQNDQYDLQLTVPYVILTLLFNLAAHLVAVHEASMALQLSPPSLMAGSIGAGMAWGGPGMLAIAAIEQWRCDECSVEESECNVDGCPRCATLSNPILVGTAPLAMMSTALIGDASIGDRSVKVMQTVSTDAPVPSLCLAGGGALASCAWAQGFFQTGLQVLLAEGAFRLTVASMAMPPPDAAVASDALALVHVLPEHAALAMLAVRRAIVPVATVLLTAGVVAGAEVAAARLLQPEASAQADATSAALLAARPRARVLFAMDAPPTEAARRLSTFEGLVDGWERRRVDVARTDRAASLARAVVCAGAFAASGGCLLAPVIASLGAAEGGELTAPPPAFAAVFATAAVAWACLAS